ncbi:carboxypeptidase O-like [Aquarana catesbeiana]|uniref:carboxypeptidase O-like n=1 Tax=Aquarana catesbeiana TaxID=8400 RepID=UPI003CC94E6C
MKFILWILFLLGAFIYGGSCLKVEYNGDQVLQIIPQTTKHAKYVQELTQNWQLDLWRPNDPERIHTGQEVHVQIPSSHLNEIKNTLLQYNIPYSVLINDVQQLIDAKTVYKKNMKPMSLDTFDYTKYHPIDEIYKWSHQIQEAYPDLVTLNILGSTYESRPIYYFKIGLPSKKNKKVLWMDCGIHAREWISVAFCQWFIRELLEHHNSNKVIKKTLENADLYIVPVINIDGFVYSWTTDRLWRKTRSPHNNGTCFGVDLNRNFDSSWCSIGASRNCSTLTFCGPRAFSEPESYAVQQLVDSLKSDVLCYLTMHSYGQYILLPYGYTLNYSVNHEEMTAVGEKAAERVAAIHGKKYIVGPASHALYSNAGSSMDWAHDIGISLAYTIELRDNGTYGFVLPEDQIKPNCEEATAGVLSIMEYINEKHFSSASRIFSGTLWINLSLSVLVGLHQALF